MSWEVTSCLSIISVAVFFSFLAINLNFSHKIIKTLFLLMTFPIILVAINQTILIIASSTNNQNILGLLEITYATISWIFYFIMAYFFIIQIFKPFQTGKNSDEKENQHKTTD